MTEITTIVPSAQRPSAVTLTPSCEARIAKLMSTAPEGAIGVKLSTPPSGCSGHSYLVDYVTEDKVGALDERIETPGGTFFIANESLILLFGMTLDWREDDFSAGFVYINPNVTASCGCGKSFSTEPDEAGDDADD
jgi:iron-sulfur cluster assembly protein